MVLTFSDRNAHFRGIDTEIAARHGIRMCSSDTIGPGGIFRALREIPHALAVARDAAKLCPDAWVINFINPTAVLGMALMRYAPGIRSFALCDGLHEPYATLKWCQHAGLLPETAASVPSGIWPKLELKIGGVNHFTWLTRFRYEGKDLLALTQEVLDTHELTAEAAVTGDRAILRRAMLTDPIVNNIGDADACIADLLAAEKDALPGYWYKRTRKLP